MRCHPVLYDFFCSLKRRHCGTLDLSGLALSDMGMESFQHFDDDDLFSTLFTSLRPTVWELMWYFESSFGMWPAERRSSSFNGLVLPATVSLSPPLSKWTEWSSKTRRRDNFAVRVTNGDQLVLASCKRVSVHRMVSCQTHNAALGIGARGWWRFLTDMVHFTTWTFLSIGGSYIQLRNDGIRLTESFAATGLNSIARTVTSNVRPTWDLLKHGWRWRLTTSQVQKNIHVLCQLSEMLFWSFCPILRMLSKKFRDCPSRKMFIERGFENESPQQRALSFKASASCTTFWPESLLCDSISKADFAITSLIAYELKR